MTTLEVQDDRDFDPTANSWYSPILQADFAGKDQTIKCDSLISEPPDCALSIFPESADAEPVERPRTHSDPNHRQFSRLSLTAERASGTLSVNGRSYSCRLVEMSIGGFGVLIIDPPYFKVGAIGSLRANGMNYIVSITRTEDRPGGGYVGLKQIEEVLQTNSTMPGEPMSFVGYLLAGLSVGLIITISMVLMNCF